MRDRAKRKNDKWEKRGSVEEGDGEGKCGTTPLPSGLISHRRSDGTWRTVIPRQIPEHLSSTSDKPNTSFFHLPEIYQLAWVHARIDCDVWHRRPFSGSLFQKRFTNEVRRREKLVNALACRCSAALDMVIVICLPCCGMPYVRR